MDNRATTDRTPAPNSTYPKGGVSCSKDSLVKGSTLEILMNFSAENPPHRKAENRYGQGMKIKWQDQEGREFSITAPKGEFSYGMIAGGKINYYYQGRVSSVGRLNVFYDYQGRISGTKGSVL
jgi:hypothetical protein